MRRNWKYGLMCVVAGLCCFVTIAEVDAGIIFRRRGTGYTTTQTTTYTSVPRRGVFGRRRGAVMTTSQAATTTAPAAVVRGQTPEAALGGGPISSGPISSGPISGSAPAQPTPAR